VTGHTVLLALEALGLPDKPDSQKPMLPRLRTGVSVLKTYAGKSHSPQPEELNRLVVNVVQLSGSQSRENGPKPVIMAEDNPSGLPRPLIYVDQNILGAPLEALIQSEAFAAWRDTVVLVYSNETMNEIVRSEGLAPEFLGNLSKFVTARVFDELDDRLRPTGRFKIRVESPQQRYRVTLEEQLLASPDLQGLGVLHKLFGGEADRSYADISAAQVGEMQRAWKSELDQIDLPAAFRELLDQLHDSIISVASGALSSTAKTLAKNLQPNGRQVTSVDFRRDLGLDMETLNSIKGDKVIERIWALIQSTNDTVRGWSFEAFCNVEGESPFTGKPYTIPDKVRSMMLILNLIGYQSDKKLSRSDKFISSQSDLGHAAYGSLCDAIVSNDIRFRKRLSAVYAYLYVPTRIFSVDVSNGFRLREETE